jgi:hypothetical protein
VSEQRHPGQISREQFRELTRGLRLLDRHGREWTVRAAPFVQDGEYRVVLHAGDLVLIERALRRQLRIGRRRHLTLGA